MRRQFTLMSLYRAAHLRSAYCIELAAAEAAHASAITPSRRADTAIRITLPLLVSRVSAPILPPILKNASMDTYFTKAGLIARNERNGLYQLLSISDYDLSGFISRSNSRSTNFLMSSTASFRLFH